MALSQTDSTGETAAQPQTITKEIDLSRYSELFPDGTIVTATFRGHPGSYTIEVDRNGERWLLEGQAKSAELTGVLGNGSEDKPERVPDWLERVLEDVSDIREVSVYA